MARERSNGATVDGEGQGPAAGTEGPGGDQGEGANPRTARSYIVVPLPPDLKTRFQEEAKVADKDVGPYVRDLLAQFLGIEIPVTAVSRRSKYASDDERKAAQKTRNQSRAATMKDLMNRYKAALAAGKSAEEAVNESIQSATTGTPAPEGEPVAA
jgi:hypothetical protein